MAFSVAYVKKQVIASQRRAVTEYCFNNRLYRESLRFHIECDSLRNMICMKLIKTASLHHCRLLWFHWQFEQYVTEGSQD